MGAFKLFEYLGSSLEYPLGNLGLAANTNSMVLSDLLYKLVLRHGLGKMIDVESLLPESSNSIHTDVLEDQQTQALILQRMEDLWLAYVGDGLATASGTEAIMDGRRAGRVGSNYLRGCWDRHGGKRRTKARKIRGE